MLINSRLLLASAAALLPASRAASVIAHYIVGTVCSYGVSDWQNDINTARATSIDGFALNVGGYDCEVAQVANAYAAAAGTNFLFFISFDMSYTWTAANMVSLVAAHATSANTYKWSNHVLISTYSGESYGNAFYAGVKSSLSSQGISTYFAPAFTTYRDPSLTSSLLSTFPSIDGFFNWWSWPADVDSTLTTATDVAYQSAIKARSGPYIMAVSPWQFKNLGDPNNWVELSDTLWYYRWQQAISLKPDIVEIVTWNDYGESHYIGDINSKAGVGVASNYVNGIVHAGWRNVALYFIQWYKTGSAPAVTTDQVIYWYRIHPKGVTCSTGTLPRNAAFPADSVFAIALLSSAATITMDIGSGTYDKHTSWNAPAGASMGSVAFPTDDAQVPFIQIQRNGVTTKSGYGAMPITNSCSYYNFNPFVGILQ